MTLGIADIAMIFGVLLTVLAMQLLILGLQDLGLIDAGFGY